jgi:hypothetical protein
VDPYKLQKADTAITISYEVERSTFPPNQASEFRRLDENGLEEHKNVFRHSKEKNLSQIVTDVICD